METIRDRAKNHFPTVLLTLLSIVQALALELLWDHLHDRPDLYEVTWSAVVGWMQIAASLNGLILIWLTYSGIVMRIRWTPTMADSILPFFIGLIEFLMIDMMGPDTFGQWLIVLAIVFAIMLTVSQHIMRRARRDPSNEEFFVQFLPATVRDFVPHAIIIGAMILAGGWLWIVGYQTWMAFSALLGTVLVLGYETRSSARYWRLSMGTLEQE